MNFKRIYRSRIVVPRASLEAFLTRFCTTYKSTPICIASDGDGSDNEITFLFLHKNHKPKGFEQVSRGLGLHIKTKAHFLVMFNTPLDAAMFTFRYGTTFQVNQTFKEPVYQQGLFVVVPNDDKILAFLKAYT